MRTRNVAGWRTRLRKRRQARICRLAAAAGCCEHSRSQRTARSYDALDTIPQAGAGRMTRTLATQTSRTAYVVIALLTASIFINYIDRSNLSVAAPVLQSQLGYTTRQIGLLSSAFFWT